MLASEAYELYGKQGVILPSLEAEDLECDTAYHEGSIGYHMSGGGHGE